MQHISFFPVVGRSKMRIHFNKTRKFLIAFGTGTDHWDFFDQIVMFQRFPPYSSVQQNRITFSLGFRVVFSSGQFFFVFLDNISIPFTTPILSISFMMPLQILFRIMKKSTILTFNGLGRGSTNRRLVQPQGLSRLSVDPYLNWVFRRPEIDH